MTDPASNPARAFKAALGAAGSPEAAYAALHRLAAALVGARLFTVMEVDLEAGLARRAYTSDPAAYPATGTKPIVRDAWFEAVHDRHETFVANTIGEIASVFPDHALIAALGCGAALNLPVLRAGALAATVNLLDAEGHWTRERRRVVAERLALPAMAAVLAARALAAPRP